MHSIQSPNNQHKPYNFYTMQQLTSVFGIIVTVLISSALGFLVGNALRYASVLQDQALLKMRMDNFDKEMVTMKLNEAELLKEIKQMKETFTSALNRIELALHEKEDRE
jgi:hypothetical protein